MRIKYKPDSVIVFIGAIFALFGIIFAVMSVCIWKEWADFKEHSVPVTAMITDIERYYDGDETRHDVFVSYEYEGKTYSSQLDYYSSNMYRGMPVEVRISPADPTVMKSNPTGIVVILGIFLLIFGGIGFGFLISQLVKYMRIRGLVARDNYIYCTEWTEAMANVRVNNLRYRCIHAYYDTGINRYEFVSGAYHPDKCPLMPGESVLVYVDIEKDPKCYYVDLSDKERFM